jgi:hypothetical protein
VARPVSGRPPRAADLGHGETRAGVPTRERQPDDDDADEPGRRETLKEYLAFAAVFIVMCTLYWLWGIYR